MPARTPGEDLVPSWEVFEKRFAPIVKEPAMTLQAGGGMSFNHAAYVALGEPKAIELLFDRTRRLIGVRPVDPSAPHAYPVRPPAEKRDKGFIVSGRAFTAYHDIETGEARRRPARLIDGVLCVDLNDPGVVVTSNRNARTRQASGSGSPGDRPV